MKQPSICISPLDWGLGHATRCIPIIQAFKLLGYKIYIATNGQQEVILKQSFPDLQFLSLPGYNIKYSKRPAFLFFSLFAQMPKMIVSIWREHRWLKIKAAQYHFDLIVSDNRFGFFHKNIPSVFITHQLNLQTPFNWTSKLYQKLLYKLLNQYRACWIPDMQDGKGLSGNLAHPNTMPNIPVWYMGVLSRLIQPSNNNQVITEEPIEFLGIVSGPEPQRSIFEKQLWEQGNALGKLFVMVAGVPENKLYNKITPKGALYHHLSSEKLIQQIQSAHYVICRGGYTSLMELLPFHKKLILVPTPGQTEQIYLAKYWAQNGWAIEIAQNELEVAAALLKANNTVLKQPDYISFTTESLATALKPLTL